MASPLEKNSGKFSSPESGSGRESLERSKQQAQEISKEAQALSEGVAEALDGSETSEFSEGNVGEEVKEGKKQMSGGSMGGAKKDDRATAGTKTFDFPRIEVMQVQIATRIQKEIVSLEKEAKKLMAKSTRQFSAFHLTGIMAKIRFLREVLATLTRATSEALKELWLRFVKNDH